MQNTSAHTDPRPTRPQGAQAVSLAYYDAWTGGDFPQALRYVAPDVVCHAPAGTITGIEAFGGFMGPFAGMLVSARLLGCFGDAHSAMIMYDTETRLVADAPGAELHTVQDGLIREIVIIFDRLPFEQARSSR